MVTAEDFRKAVTEVESDLQKPMQYSPENARDEQKGAQVENHPFSGGACVSTNPYRRLQSDSVAYRKSIETKKLGKTERTGFEPAEDLSPSRV